MKNIKKQKNKKILSTVLSVVMLLSILFLNVLVTQAMSASKELVAKDATIINDETIAVPFRRTATTDITLTLCGHTSAELSIKGDKKWDIEDVPIDRTLLTAITGNVDLTTNNYEVLIAALPQNIGEWEELKGNLGTAYAPADGPIGYYNGASEPLSRNYPIAWGTAVNNGGDITITGSFESQSKRLVQFTTPSGETLSYMRYGVGMNVEMPVQTKAHAEFVGWWHEGTIYNVENPYTIEEGVEPIFTEVWESALLDDEKYHVETVSPDHVTINLFDYWKIEGGSSAMLEESLDYTASTESGINENRPFKFWPNGLEGNNEQLQADKLGKQWHDYTGAVTASDKDFNEINFKDGPFTGIVESNLGTDGYPLLSDDGVNKGIEGGVKAFSDAKGYEWLPSLDYLFEPEGGDIVGNEILQYREEYLDVQGLLQLDEDGTYYYNSRENFAELDKDTGKFTVYNVPAVMRGSAGATCGQFFPFDSAEEVFNMPNPAGDTLTHNTKVIANDKIQTYSGSTANTLNHYMGMTMKTQFIQPLDGFVRKGNDLSSTTDDTPMYLEFIGDDDIWIYIDGVLVADKGGLRDAMYCYIDFSTGDVKIMRLDDYEALQTNPNHDLRFEPIETTILQIFEDAGRDTSEFELNTFADNTDHVLDVFYLERGAGGSDLQVEFNLLNRYVQSIEKVDQNGNPMEGVEFDIIRVTGEDTWSDVGADATPIMTLTSNENGQLPLTYPSTFTDIAGMAGKPVDFDLLAKLGITKFVAREKNHSGYIPTPDIWLEYDPILGILNVINSWKTGVSTSNNVHLSQVQTGITLRSGDEVEGMTNANGVVDKERASKGTIIGLPYFLPIGEELMLESNWQPMYGSTNDGFHSLHEDYIELPTSVSETYGIDWTTVEQSTLAMLMQLAGKNIDEDGNVHNVGIGMGQYEEWILSVNSGTDRFEGDIMGLPDDLSEYVFKEDGSYEGKNHTLGYWFFDVVDLQVELGTVVGDGNVLTAEGAMSIDEAKNRDLVYLDQQALTEINSVVANGTQEAKNQLVVYSYNIRVTGDATGNAVGTYEKTLQWVTIMSQYMHAVDLSSFDRDYTTDIVVPNVLRSFEIQKVGDDGKNLAGAQFALYDNAECNGNALATGTTDENGKIVVSNEGSGDTGSMNFHLEPTSSGTHTIYYLKEISAPAGYEINDTVIKVNVDVTGVYIDAGGATDAVSVRSSLVGSVPTVDMFGISDGYNETLKEIQTVEYLLDDFTVDRTQWNKGDDSIIYTQTNKHDNNRYIPNADGLQYFEAEEGLVVMYIKQYNPTADYKEDISGKNIAALFEVVQTAVVTDQQDPDAYDWKIEIEIEGEGTVDPDGGVDSTVYVMNGGNQSFRMTPAEGWYLFDVQIDGVSIGDPSTYDFTNVTQDHKIKVIFKITEVPPTEPTDPPTESTDPPTDPPTDLIIPSTGDNSNVFGWLLLALSSIVVICVLRKRLGQKDNYDIV